MDGIFEYWSLPWHTLQRALAHRVVAPAASWVNFEADARAETPSQPNGNWLTRVRSRIDAPRKAPAVQATNRDR